jgi:hypothetical protein
VKQPKIFPAKHTTDHLILSHRDAEAGSPQDTPIAGEEDPGAALENFVEFAQNKPTIPKKPGKS